MHTTKWTQAQLIWAATSCFKFFKPSQPAWESAVSLLNLENCIFLIIHHHHHHTTNQPPGSIQYPLFSKRGKTLQTNIILIQIQDKFLFRLFVFKWWRWSVQKDWKILVIVVLKANVSISRDGKEGVRVFYRETYHYQSSHQDQIWNTDLSDSINRQKPKTKAEFSKLRIFY